MDEPFCFSVGFGGIGFGANMAQPQLSACGLEGLGLIATAIIGHDALNCDAHRCVPLYGCLQMLNGAYRFLIGKDLCIMRGFPYFVDFVKTLWRFSEDFDGSVFT